jgi:branched-chain amino acid transport system permease protein
MFVIAAAMASVSGSLAVHYLRVMDPHVFSFAYTLNLLTAVIIGGLMSIWGGPIGAIFIVGLREVLRDLSLPLWEAIIMGGLTVIALIVFPHGIAGFISRTFDRIVGSGRRTRTNVEPPDLTALPPIAGGAGGADRILEVAGVARTFGSLRAVRDVSFVIERGTITAIIGPNGAGKTTLFNLIDGYQPLDAGSIRYEGQTIGERLPNRIACLGIGRTFQSPLLFDNMTVLENVMCGRHRLMSAGIVGISLRLPGVPREEAEARQAALNCLRFVGLAGAAGQRPSALSFGHLRLVEIARALAVEPRLLLLDEPASGLNDAETERLAEIVVHVAALGVTILFVEHDMRLVMGLADRIVVMHHGEKLAEGPVDLVRADPSVIAAYLGQEVEERVA